MKPVQKIKVKHYSREVLRYLFVAGILMVGGSSPSVSRRIAKKIFSGISSRKKAANTFYYLKRKGLVEMKREGYDIRIALTEKGRELAGKYQIDDLSISRPKKWDKRWRVIVFDIPSTSNMIRDVFRRKLKEFGFHQLQKSTWIYPFDCKEEIRLLREFLGANTKQIHLLEVSKMEDDRYLRKIFNV